MRLLLLVAALIAAAASNAQSYPSKPVRFLVGYATGGIGSTPHIAAELLSQSLGVKLVHVPYKGENPAVADVISGQIPLMFSNISAVLPFAKAGRVRALAITSPKRSPLAPEYPTVAESGLPGFDVATWAGLYAPAAINREHSC